VFALQAAPHDVAAGAVGQRMKDLIRGVRFAT
jgi:hypothetical protein